MIKIGITGSLSSGKTTSSKIISHNRGLLFNADIVVKKLYKKNNFKKIIAKQLDLKISSRFKDAIKNKILKEKKILKKLERITHPFVRKEMFVFMKKNKKKKFLFFEIPLLIESKLSKYFDLVIFIKSKRNLRIKRFKSKGGSEKLFRLLDKHQIQDNKKMRFCDHIIVNNKSLAVLKKNLLNIIRLYE